MSPVEIAAFVFTLICVALTVRQNIWCWPTGIIGVSLYAVVFYQSKLYADMGLQAVYFVVSFYGWYHWLHGKGGEMLPATWATRRMLWGSIAAGAVGTVLLALLLTYHTDAAVPWGDSALTSFSLVAQWLLSRKHIENWIIWIIVDFFYVILFAYKDLNLTAVLYAIFFVLAILGYYEWKKTLVAEPA
jgi:nicotinamide mononucleotide transporter